MHCFEVLNVNTFASFLNLALRKYKKKKNPFTTLAALSAITLHCLGFCL
jgi:hypothetical protein